MDEEPRAVVEWFAVRPRGDDSGRIDWYHADDLEDATRIVAALRGAWIVKRTTTEERIV